MFLWFAALAAVGVWAVFDSPAVDYRYVMAGAVLPLVELPFGRPAVLHSLAGAVLALAIVMGVTRGRRLVRRRWLGIPIGLFAHLVLDGVWTDTHAFWWPIAGTDFSHSEPPELGRGGLSLLFELIGLAALLWWANRTGLDDRRARDRFLRTGRLPRNDG